MASALEGAPQIELPRPDGLMRVQNGLGTSQDWQYAEYAPPAPPPVSGLAARHVPPNDRCGDGGQANVPPGPAPLILPPPGPRALSERPPRSNAGRCRSRPRRGGRSRDGDSRRIWGAEPAMTTPRPPCRNDAKSPSGAEGAPPARPQQFGPRPQLARRRTARPPADGSEAADFAATQISRAAVAVGSHLAAICRTPVSGIPQLGLCPGGLSSGPSRCAPARGLWQTAAEQALPC